MQASRPGFFSEKAKRTGAPPISYLMAAAVTNKDLISLAAGLVDYASLPAEETRAAVEALLVDPERARQALQYGTTEGLTRLREQVLDRYLDGPARRALTVDDVVIGTGSQQLLYLVAEELLDPGDIVFLPAPSYFVFMGALESMGARPVGIPMDEALLFEMGERICNVERAIVVRDGRTRATDTLPDFFFNVPIADGPQMGRKLDRKKFEKMKDEYYRLRGWDVKTGLPKRRTLEELDMKDVADYLGKQKKLAPESEE